MLPVSMAVATVASSERVSSQSLYRYFGEVFGPKPVNADCPMPMMFINQRWWLTRTNNFL